MNYYVLVYDRAAQRVVEKREFPADSLERALAARNDFVLRERSHPDIEVVLLGASSFDALKTTHSRYFEFKAVEEIVLST